MMAKFQSDYANYMVRINGVNVHFKRGRFETENPDLIQALEEHNSFGVEFYRIDKAGKPAWKERLKPKDKPQNWSDKTLETFKQGGDILRCEHGCGFATTRAGALGKHQQNCANAPTNDNSGVQ